MRCWDDASGRKFIVGEISGDSVQSKFARNDLLSSDKIYRGLSLQHIHRDFTDGTSSKEAVEVSLCKNPRRPGCEIVAVVPAPVRVRATIEKCGYKGKRATQASMSTKPDTPVVVDEKMIDPTKEPVATDEDEDEEPGSVDNTELMKQVVELSASLAAANGKVEEQRLRAESFEKVEQGRELAARNDHLSHIDKLTRAVMEQVVNASDDLKGVGREDMDKAIGILKENHPEECRKVLEIACCASERAKTLELKLAKQKEEYENKLMRRKYDEAVAARPGCHPPQEHIQEEVQVHASKRSRPNPYAVTTDATAASAYGAGGSLDNAAQIRDAYHALRGRGSATDNMKEISGIIAAQRKAGHR